jgi:predicted metal-dependent hydrolase
VAGFALASTILLTFWMLGAVMLVMQDETATWARVQAELRTGKAHGYLGRPAVVRAVLAFVRPGFHPWNKDNLALAMSYLAKSPSSATA